VETAEHSADWFGLEGENERLKEENHLLKEENNQLEEEVSKLRLELEQQPYSKKCPKCRHFDAL
jgi:cell division protein FtsB